MAQRSSELSGSFDERTTLLNNQINDSSDSIRDDSYDSFI